MKVSFIGLGIAFILFYLAGNSFGQGSESFTNMPANSSSYSNRSWTGDDGKIWSATDARTDQTILSSRALCFGQSGTGYLISQTYSNGIGTLSFKYVRALSNTFTRTLEIYIGGSRKQIISISPTSDEVMTFSEEFRISGNFQLEIKSTGSGNVKIDDISWDAYYPGWKISNLNTLYKIDFDNTVDEINNGQFTGNGFTSNPVSGQINSRGWAVIGFSDGNLNFEGSKTTSNTDFTRGISSGGVTTGGIYAFTVSENNRALGFQANDDDFTPGSVTLKIRNHTNSNISSLLLCYTIYVRNDRANSSSFNFSHSADNSSYTQVSGINLSSHGTQDVSPAWKAYIRTIKLEGLNISHNNNYYLRWSSDFISGTGEADEFALDDIQIVANPSDEIPSVNGTVKELVVNGNIKLSGSTTVSDTLKLSSGKIYAGNYNLTVNSVTGAGSGSYVSTNGTGCLIMKSSGNAGKTFPVGTESSYNPVFIKHTGTAADFSVKVTPTGAPGSVYAVPRVWDITPSITVNNCTFELIFSTADYSGTSFDPAKTVVLGNYDGSAWQPNSASITNVSSPYTLKAENLKMTGSTSSKYAIGNNGAFTIYSQNFDGTWTGTGLNRNLPDDNWESSPTTGNNSWRREDDGGNAGWINASAGTVKPYGNTGHSANFHSYDATKNDVGSLVLKNLTLNGAVLLSFDYTNPSGTDELNVYFSSNDGSNWTNIGTFTTGSWSKKILSLGNFSNVSNCRIKFEAKSDYGRSDIGIDNVNIYNGTLQAQDPRVVSIDVSNAVSGTVIPKATIKNFGTSSSTFKVTLTTSGYTDESTNASATLGAGQTTQVSFTSWTPVSGNTYTLTASTYVSEVLNNSLDKNVEASTSGNWSSGNNPSSYNTVLGSGTASSTYLFSIGGFPTATASYRYGIDGNVETITSLPVGKFYHATAIAGDYLYAIGGRVGGAYLNTVFRYNIANGLTNNSWEDVNALTSVDLPNIGWCKAVTYNNRFIFLVGGYNGTDVLSSVYMLDVNNISNGWVSMTSLSQGRFGGALSIAGSTLVYVAGASDVNTLTNTVYAGTINLEGGVPTSITWALKSSRFQGSGKPVIVNSNENLTITKYESKEKSEINNKGDGPESVFPAGSLYCLDAAPWGSDAVAVSGGTSNSSISPEDPTPFYVYKPSTDTWTAMPEVPIPVAGSSVGSANTSGNTWKYLSFSGETFNNVNTASMQVWTTANITTGYGGSFGAQLESTGSLLESGITNELVIELREATAPYLVAESKSVVQNGSQNINLEFVNVQSGKPYYVVIRYANGLETWSAQPQYFINGQMNYDFTIAQTQAYGNNLVNVNGKWCIISGDIDQDGKINAMDRGICWNDRGSNDVYSDLNHDGVVNELDRAILAKNKNMTVKKPEGAVTSKLKIGKRSNKVTSD